MTYKKKFTEDFLCDQNHLVSEVGVVYKTQWRVSLQLV